MDWTVNQMGRREMKDKINRMKDRSGFTLVELIAVMAILAILLVIAVPQMRGYIEAAHKAAARTEIQIVADAAQRYLDDLWEQYNGKPPKAETLKLMNLDLSEPDGVLVDYLSGGVRDARIYSVFVDINSGRLEKIVYQTKYAEVTMTIGADGSRTLKDDEAVKE